MYRQLAPTFNKSAFDVDDVRQLISQEASMLGLPPGVKPYGRLIGITNEQGEPIHVAQGERPPGCTVGEMAESGIILRLGDLGRISKWQLTQVDGNEDDIAGWQFEPTSTTVERFPDLMGWRILIIND